MPVVVVTQREFGEWLSYFHSVDTDTDGAFSQPNFSIVGRRGYDEVEVRFTFEH
jgi:hypothetical protein